MKKIKKYDEYNNKNTIIPSTCPHIEVLKITAGLAKYNNAAGIAKDGLCLKTIL